MWNCWQRVISAKIFAVILLNCCDARGIIWTSLVLFVIKQCPIYDLSLQQYTSFDTWHILSCKLRLFFSNAPNSSFKFLILHLHTHLWCSTLPPLDPYRFNHITTSANNHSIQSSLTTYRSTSTGQITTLVPPWVSRRSISYIKNLTRFMVMLTKTLTSSSLGKPQMLNWYVLLILKSPSLNKKLPDKQIFAVSPFYFTLFGEHILMPSRLTHG